MPSHSAPGQKRHRGALLVLVMAMIGLFGTLAALQMLVHASAGLTSRAFEHRRQRMALSLRMQRAVGEALLSTYEVGRDGSGSLQLTLAQKLAELHAGSAKIRVDSCPATVSAPVMFPDLQKDPDPVVEPSAGLLAMASPELRALMGPRVAESRAGRMSLGCELFVLGQPLSYSFSFDARLIAVPLTRFGRLAYELPHEIGTAESKGVRVNRPDSLGLVPDRDVAAVESMRSAADALPYHFRRKASVAGAYQYLFSQAYVDRLALYAGPAHILDLDLPDPDVPVIDGFSRLSSSVELDLGIAGRGRWGSIDSVRPVLIVSAGKPGVMLKIKDSLGVSEAQPMILMLMGTQAVPLSVEISSISRPLILIGFNLSLSTAASVIFNGALFLDPGCSLHDLPGLLHAAHFSYAAGNPNVHEASVATDLPLSPDLELIAPRVIHVAVAPISL